MLPQDECMQSPEIDHASAALTNASWNETPAAFIYLTKLAVEEQTFNLREEYKKIADLEAVAGQADLLAACHIAQNNDRDHLHTFIQAIEKIRGHKTSWSKQAIYLKQALELIGHIMSLATKKELQSFLPILTRASYNASYISEILPLASKEVRGLSYNLAIALEDLQSVPKWGKEQLLACKQSHDEIYTRFLNPELEDDRRVQFSGLFNPYFHKIVVAEDSDKKHMFLELCEFSINQVATRQLTPLEAASELHYAINFPALIADESLHPLLIAIVNLEYPGEIINGDVLQKWAIFEDIYTTTKS
jgi:hypothetical protein